MTSSCHLSVAVCSPLSSQDPFLPISSDPCHCHTYTIATRIRRVSSSESIRCDARTLRGRAFVACHSTALITYKSTQATGRRRLCRSHYLRYISHQTCAHCNMFTQFGHMLSCPLDSSHMTHWRCAKKFSPGTRLLCSHCNTPTDSAPSSSQLTNDTEHSEREDGRLSLSPPVPPSLSRLPSSPSSSLLDTRADLLFALDNKTQSISDICLLHLKNGGDPLLAELAVRQLLDCAVPQPSSFSSGLLLTDSIHSNQPTVALSLRQLSSPLLSSHLFALLDNYSEEMFNALLVPPDLVNHLISSRDDSGYTVLQQAVHRENWHFITRILSDLEKRGGLDSSMQKYTEKGRGLIERCSGAPRSVQESLSKAVRVHEYGKLLRRKRIIIRDLSNGCERFPIQVVNDVDDEVPVEFRYTTRVLDEGGILEGRREQRRQTETLTCWCKDQCTSNCDCSSNVYDEHGRASSSSLDAAFLECSSDCMCSMRCGNRVAQKGAVYPIEVFRSCDARGWAVRALSPIPRGSFIGEYTGELLSDTDANSRIDSYLFETSVGDSSYTVDARLVGNFTRFVNHSCKPNAKVCMVVWDWQREQLSHICLFAARDIACGEEITITYGEHWWQTKMMEFACLCGSEGCEFSVEKREALLRAKEGGSLGDEGSCCSDDG